MCVTATSVDELECELSHVVCVCYDHWLSDQHCKGLTNHQAFKGAVYKPRHHPIHPIFMNEGVFCKYHNALVLYIKRSPHSLQFVGHSLVVMKMFYVYYKHSTTLDKLQWEYLWYELTIWCIQASGYGTKFIVPALWPLCLQDQNH